MPANSITRRPRFCKETPAATILLCTKTLASCWSLLLANWIVKLDKCSVLLLSPKSLESGFVTLRKITWPLFRKFLDLCSKGQNERRFWPWLNDFFRHPHVFIKVLVISVGSTATIILGFLVPEDCPHCLVWTHRLVVLMKVASRPAPSANWASFWRSCVWSPTRSATTRTQRPSRMTGSLLQWCLIDFAYWLSLHSPLLPP